MESEERRAFCRRQRAKGNFWLSVSAFLFAVMAFAVRLAGDRGLPGSEATLVRFVFGLVAIFVYVHFSGHRLYFHKTPLLVTRGVVGGLSILLYFSSLSTTTGYNAVPLTNSVFLGNSYFIYTPILGAILLRERMCISTVAMIVVALVGLYLVAMPDFADLRLGDVYAFVGGIFAGVALVAVRDLRRTESALSIFFFLCFVGGIAAVIWLLFEKPVVPNATGLLLLLVIAISSTLAQLTFTYGMRYSLAGEGSIIQMSSVIYSSLAGILLLGDPINLRIALGAILVIGSAMYISLVGSRNGDC